MTKDRLIQKLKISLNEDDFGKITKEDITNVITFLSKHPTYRRNTSSESAIRISRKYATNRITGKIRLPQNVCTKCKRPY